jgi:sensor histidine kinase YesM
MLMSFLGIVIQLVNLIMAAKKNYDEQLNYEKVQSELLKSRVTIMISQIQPHFLYNSLTSIAQLCEKDPKRAKTATIDFANYLRGNMNSIKDEHPVPFETELSHLKTYLSLEKMRFGDDLNIVYDIGVTDFTIPSLTVQPLVENTVKHGVGMKEDGETVTISTKEYDDHYEVVVSDDGVGFDTTKPNPDTSRTHLGIENIKERISTMSNGDVTIESEAGKGTVSTIKIFKDTKED